MLGSELSRFMTHSSQVACLVFTLFQAVCPQISFACAFRSCNLNTHLWLNPANSQTRLNMPTDFPRKTIWTIQGNCIWKNLPVNLCTEPLPPPWDSFQTEFNLLAKSSTSLHVKNKACHYFRPQHYRTMPSKLWAHAAIQVNWNWVT